MAKLDDVLASVAALGATQQKVSTDVAAAVADIKALGDQITALKNQGGATPDQLDQIKAAIDAITPNLQSAATSLEAAVQ